MQANSGNRFRKIFLLALLGVVLAVFIDGFVSRDSREKAKAVHYWVTAIDSRKGQEVREALLEFGPQAVPYLIQELRRTQTPWTKLLSMVGSYLPGPVRKWLPRPGEITRTRRNALWALGVFGPDAKCAVPALCKALDDSDTEVRKRALEVLIRIGPEAHQAVPKLVQLVKSNPKSIPLRWLLIHTLGEIGPPAQESLPTLIGLLGVKGETDRLFIPSTLVKIDPSGERVTPPLIECLHDPDSRLRQKCAYALGALGPPAQQALPALLEALNDADKCVRQSAVYGLLQNGVTNADTFVSILLDVLNEKQSPDARFPNPYRQGAAGLLGKIGPTAKKASLFLIEALKEDDFNLQFYAAEALWRVDRQPNVVVPVLISFLNDEKQRFSSRAAKLLGEIGLPARETVPKLAEQMKDYREQVRSPRIFRMMDEDKYPSFYAAEAIWRITREPKDVVPVFTKFLKAKESSFRIRAAELLGEIGPEAKEAIPALRTAMHDKDKVAQKASRNALNRIASQEIH